MIRIVVIAIFLFLPQISTGKTRQLFSSDLSFPANRKEMVKALEERFKPILEHKASRIKRSRGFSSNLQQKISPDSKGPSDRDFLLLVQLWDELSPEFKALYKTAATIPDSFLTIISPSGNFDISYSLKGTDAVDSTDNYGYSRLNWRLREERPNGIPDYIDEVGWALDSCWSAQIDRFELNPPAPFLKKGNSNRYSIIVEEQYPYDYGLTWVGEKAADSLKGYSSYISLRNNWPTTYWEEQGYDKNPQSGIRVTCAHEFFHAVQYAMSWNVISKNGLLYLDKFPLSWIEGSATAMEDFLFKDINDYIQYANFYFSYPGPQMSFFDGSNNVYTNSILFLYLLKATAHVNNNNFITIVHKNNFTAPIDFHQNINSAAKTFGVDWATLLNDFHTASFFSGYLADTNRFISDAPLFGHWSFQENSSSRAGSTKSINPYAMEKYYIKRSDSDIDTLNIFFQNETGNQTSTSNKLWAASIIISKIDGYTVIPVQLDSNKNGCYRFTEWKNADYALAVVSNSNPEQVLPYSVWFEYSAINYLADSTYVIHPYNKNDVSLTLYTKTYLRGNLQISQSDGQNLNIDSMHLMANTYDIIIPGSWKNDFYRNDLTITFSLKFPSDIFSAENFDSSIYHYNNSSASWEKLTTALTRTSDSVLLSAEIIESGIYATKRPVNKSSEKLVVYPNRVHLRHLKSDSIFICGVTVSKIKIYGLDGSIKYEGSPSQNSNLKKITQQVSKYCWLIPKQLFSPGIYSMAISYKDNSGKKNTSLQKLIVAP